MASTGRWHHRSPALLQPALLLGFLAKPASAGFWSPWPKACAMPEVEYAPFAGSCLEARGKTSKWEVPGGDACTPWCSMGYKASEEKLMCKDGGLTPAKFTCAPLADCKDCNPAEAPESYEISKCMDDFFTCGKKRLKYATHLAQAGDWENIDDESWRPQWPPRNRDIEA